MTPKERENYAKSMEKTICNLAQDVKNAPSLEELVDALRYLLDEVEDMMDEAQEYLNEEEVSD